MYIGLADTILWPKILASKLGILTQILIAMDFYFFLYFREAPTIQKKTKAFVRKNFGSPHTSHWIYLPQNCFSNHVYLKDLYITLKGIEKILFVLVLRILLICKFLNFAAVFIQKNLNFPKLAYNFPCEKVNFSLIHPTHITIHSF